MPRFRVEIFQVITLTGRPANEPGERRDLIAGNTLLMRIASTLYMTMAAPVRPFSCNTGIKVTSAELGSPAYVIRPLLWVRLFGRIQKRICDLRSYEFFSTETTEDPKKDHLRLLYTSVAYRFFFFRKTACQKCFFQILPQKNALIVNLRNTDLDLIRRIHPECGFFGSHPSHDSRTRTRVSSLRLPSI